MKQYTVTIGAGHGGHDWGTIGPHGLAEKEITLSIARDIRSLLASTGAFHAFVIRDSDVYVDTFRRAELAACRHSMCHIEVHLNLSDPCGQCTGVWHDAELLSDRPFAAHMSRRISRSLGIPDMGAKAHYEYGTIFQKALGFEDYYDIFEALRQNGISHIFYVECCLGDHLSGKRNAESRAGRIADAVAHTVCELFSVWYRPRILFQPRKREMYRLHFTSPVMLNSGCFKLYCGPGENSGILQTISGSIYTNVYSRSGSWLNLSAYNTAYLNSASVDVYFTNKMSTVRRSALESTRKNSFYYIRDKPSQSSGILGATGGGEFFLTIKLNGWRRISYSDRPGFISDFAWE